MSEILQPTNNDCKRCGNKGYTHLLYKAGENGETQSMFTFCTCDGGKQLRQITVDFRLADLASFAKEILPRLDKAKGLLHNPEEAGKEIQLLQNEIRNLMSKVEKATQNET